MFDISITEFGTVGMPRGFCTCTYDFLMTVTKGVVQGVHKVVIRLSLDIIQRHKVS